MKTKTKHKLKHCKEFEAEGLLSVVYSGGAPSFIIDDCHLSEFVVRHFRPEVDDNGMRNLGRCKVLIIPIHE